MRRSLVASCIILSSLGIACGGGGGGGSKPALAVATVALPTGQADVAYSAILAATGGTAPYSWSVASGRLPPGLILDGSSGAITGTPPLAGTSSFVVGVADAGSRAATKALSIAVLPASGIAALEGDPSAPAVGALRLLDGIDGVTEAEISVDALGREVARTKLLVRLSPGATVGQVNALLGPLRARIIGMIPPVPQLLLRIPDPGGLAALDAVIVSLEASPAIEAALEGFMPELASVPPGFDPRTLENVLAVDHLLSVEVAAAWNARAALAGRFPPVIVVADFFGDGPPVVPPFDAAFLGGFSLETYFECKVPGHGYHVLGIIGADHGKGDGQWVTGLYPGQPAEKDIRAIDIWLDPEGAGDPPSRLSSEELNEKILLEVAHYSQWDRPIVVNTSLGWRGLDVAEASKRALAWIEAVRSKGLEGQFIHATAAGNNLGLPASLISGWAAAALLPLVDGAGRSVANLGNTLVVENLLDRPEPPYHARCLWKGYLNGTIWEGGSRYGGNLSAIGTDVLSYVQPEGLAEDMSGTSMASPQVAAVAAYLWALAPHLTSQEVATQLLDTADRVTIPDPLPADWPANCQDLQPANVLDAYAALLRADRPEALLTGSPADAPVRFALLDASDSSGASGPDGIFDQGDLRRFLQGFREGPAGSIPDAAGCGGYEWSRYDLNGDGRTGGCHADRFDLDMDGQYGMAQQNQGSPVRYWEAGLRDQDVLCYYAYSPLYVGSASERDAMLAGLCAVRVEEMTRWETPWAPSLYRPILGPYGETAAVAGSGDVFVVWSEPTDASSTTCCDESGQDCFPRQVSTSYAIRARVSRLDGPPDVFTIARATVSGDYAHVALAAAADGGGNALAAWIVSAPADTADPCGNSGYLSRLELWSSRYSRETGWGPAIRLWDAQRPSAGIGGSRLAAGLDKVGTATLVWAVLNGDALSVQSTADGVWGPIEALSPVADLTYDLAYASTPSGHGMAAWIQGTDLWYRRHDSTGWLAAEILYPGWGHYWPVPLISVNGRGDAVLAVDQRNGDFWTWRRDVDLGWQPAETFQLPDFGSAAVERVHGIVLDDTGGVAYLGDYQEDTPSYRRVAWAARYDDAARTWSEPAIVADYVGGLARSGFGPRGYGAPYYCRGVPGARGIGLRADTSGDLTAWAQDVEFLRDERQGDWQYSTARVLVVARRYHAASGTWGPIETVYSTAEGMHDSITYDHGTEQGYGRVTGVLDAGGSCGQPVLAGVLLEWGSTISEGVWCENSLHLARLGLAGH